MRRCADSSWARVTSLVDFQDVLTEDFLEQHHPRFLPWRVGRLTPRRKALDLGDKVQMVLERTRIRLAVDRSRIAGCSC